MNITRRFFLQSSAAMAAYCGLTPLRVLADAGLDPANLGKVRRGKTLVVVFLRGGMDGLNFIVPYKDPNYYKLRSGIAIPEPGKPERFGGSERVLRTPPARRRAGPVVPERPGRGDARRGL